MKSLNKYKYYLVSCAFAAVFVPQQAYALQGDVVITGNVFANTCAVTPAANFSVALPSVQMTDLQTPGAIAGETLFNIELSACSAGLKTAQLYFETNTTNVSAAGRLANTHAEGATNVEVEITLPPFDQHIDLLFPGRPFPGYMFAVLPVTISGQTASIALKARYVATGIAGPGVFTSFLNYAIAYE